MSSELILDALLAATAVISIAWLAAVAARRAPAALRNTLWRMALVGFWVAPAIVIATHAGPWQPHTIAVPLLPAAQEVAQAMPPGSDLSATAASLSPASTIPRAPVAPQRTPPPRHIPPVSLLLLLWAGGAALGMIYLIKDLRAVRRLILATRPLDDPTLQQRVTALAAQLGLRTSPAVAASSAISTPTVAGQGVPVLLLPEDFSSAPGSDDAVIVHELAHIRRGDLLVYSAARLTRALWWWHPLAWLMARELVLSAEQACDDWAVALTGQRKDYAATLVDWAEAATAVAGLPCAPRGRALVKRVRHILQSTQAPRLHLSWQARTILAICAMGMVVLVASVHLRAVAYSDSGTTSATKSTDQVDESALEFNLDVYLGTEVAEEPGEIPDGYRLMAKDDAYFLTQSEPVLTESDLRDVRHTGAGIFVFELAESAVGKLQTLTEQNIGKHLVVLLNDEVVAAVRIEEKIADGQVSIPAEGLTEHQAEWLAGYRILPFIRRFVRAGVWEQYVEAGKRMMEKDYAGAVELYATALRKVTSDPHLALRMRSQIITCHRVSADVSRGTPAGAVAVATDALPDAVKAHQAQDDGGYWFGPSRFSIVAQVLVLWKEDASREELSQALALVGYTVERASEEAEAARRYGQDQSLQVYQSMALWGRIHAARAKARLGDAAIAKAELKDLMGECVQPHELVRAKYCLGKTLAESGQRQEAAKFLRQASAHLDASILDYPAGQWLQEDIARLLAEMGEAIEERPSEIVPGTGKIIVKARFGDGVRPLGAECRIQTWTQAQLPPRRPGSSSEYLVPEVVGAYGDWTIYNVGEGEWGVGVRGDDCAFTREANASGPIEVKPGEEKVLRFTLLRGGSVSGRVVYADTGKPVEGALVHAGPVRDTTDAEGHYMVRYLAPGHAVLIARAEGYVPGRRDAVEVKDEAIVTAPDIKVRRGGWISGQVLHSEDAPGGLRLDGGVLPHFEGDPPRDAVTSSGRLSEDGDFRFRVGPLPPGSYTLEALLATYKGKMVDKRWAGEVKGVQVNVGEETKDVVIEVRLVNE